jgi:hypothetical protein
MKRYLILFLLASFGCLKADAQLGKDSVFYLFNDFKDAIVYLADGTQTKEKINYNLEYDKLSFIDPEDRLIKFVTNSQNILSLKIDNRIFFMNGKNLVELLSTTPTVYVQYKQRIRGGNTKGAYGTLSDAASIKTYEPSQHEAWKHSESDLSDIVVGERYHIYWVEKDGKLKQFENIKQFSKIYPKHQNEIKQYLENNAADFGNVKEIKRLCAYMYQL